MAAFILAYFASVKGSKSVLELCSGSGTVSFWNYDRGFNGRTVMVDLRAEQLLLAEKTADENSFNVHTCCCDVSGFIGAERFDAVICNPPFFDEKNKSSDPDKNAVRHENGLDLHSLCYSAARNIKQKGHFYICHLPERLPDIFQNLREAGFEPKQVRFCRHSPDRNPFIVLLDSVYKGGKRLTVLPDLYVYNNEGEYSDEMIEICERGFI